MQFFGLTALQFASLLGGSVLVIAVLYRLRLRRRTVVVSFAPLWRRVVRDRPATSLFERLRRLLSFLLQVAFVFLVLLAIARPRLSVDAGRERRFVVVIDASARMQALMEATGTRARTRLDEAKDLTRTLIGRLGDTDRAMIVCGGLTPEALTAFETDREPLLDAIRLLHPYDCASDLDAAVRFAGRLIPDSPERVFVFTDRPPDDTLSSVHWRQVGTPLDNLAITRFAARTPPASPGEYQLFFEVRNFGKAEANVRLHVRRGDTLLENRALRLPPGGTIADVIRGIASDDMRMTGEITRSDGSELSDAVPIDNRAFAVVRAPRITRVGVVGGANFFLDSVLKSDPLIRWKRAPTQAFITPWKPDVVVFDGVSPTTRVPRAIFIAAPGDSPVRTSGEITDVFVDRLASDHPVMRFVGRLGDLSILKSRVLDAEAGDVVLASCAGSPVMLARDADGRRLVALGFDLRESDLVLRVAFPKIFRNALSWLVSGRVSPPPTHLTAGESVTTTGPEGTGRFVARRTGFHDVNGRTVAVNVSDETTSNLHAVPPRREKGVRTLLPVGPKGASHKRVLTPFSARTSVGWELWPYLVACALALTLTEWVSYHRRWTV